MSSKSKQYWKSTLYWLRSYNERNTVEISLCLTLNVWLVDFGIQWITVKTILKKSKIVCNMRNFFLESCFCTYIYFGIIFVHTLPVSGKHLWTAWAHDSPANSISWSTEKEYSLNSSRSMLVASSWFKNLTFADDMLLKNFRLWNVEILDFDKRFVINCIQISLKYLLKTKTIKSKWYLFLVFVFFNRLFWWTAAESTC